MDYSRELESAIRIAREAGATALRYFDSETETEDKSDDSPVTAADRECEAQIAAALGQEFPDDGIVGEEGTSRPSRSGRRWLIDPIDGTRDFVRRTPFWAVQIALEAELRVRAGVIHLPCLGQTAFAAENAGAYVNDSRVEVSDVSRLDRAVLLVSGFRHAWEVWPPAAVRYLTQSCWTVRAHSGCYDVSLMMSGKADIWLSGSGMQWDYGPPRILAQEAGAVFLTRDGGDSIYRNHCLIVVPGLEAELRRVLGIPQGPD